MCWEIIPEPEQPGKEQAHTQPCPVPPQGCCLPPPATGAISLPELPDHACT